ncbi:interleukin-12 subunit alpha [Channa argus]|uniref:interleukin-12 subunit alpha n=1 Tax=Channa argus TaxID=215402 RepID=UPI002946D483|nr:hypothetical protein Q8A73_006549 [Channa argus]
MANFKTYFTCCLMLLALSWRASTGAPVSPSPSPESCTQSSHRYKDLLLKITELLNNSTELCYGIASEAVAIRNQDTLLACAPTQTSGCVNQRQSSFSESECLMNIMKDLAYYEATITSYLESPLRDQVREVTLLMPTQETIKSLRTNCSLNGENGENSKEKSAQQWGKNSFTNRQEMCKIMKGFYTRTITINRAMGYISSGDHRK